MVKRVNVKLYILLYCQSIYTKADRKYCLLYIILRIHTIVCIRLI